MRCRCTGLRALPPPAAINALRTGSRAAGRAAVRARLAEALRQMLDAEDDHLPAWSLGRARAAPLSRPTLFLTPAILPAALARAASGTRRATLAGGLGRLRWAPQRGGLDPRGCRACWCAGVAAANPEARRCAEPRACSICVNPWACCPGCATRCRWCLRAMTLIAVGDLWLDARWCVAAGAGLGIVWEGAPRLLICRAGPIGL
jgi:hypothetical protein